MKEVWKDIEDYEGMYQVSNRSRIRSLDRYVQYNCENQYARYTRRDFKKGRILKPILINNGYHVVGLSKNGETVHRSVHRLVAKAFLPNPKNKPFINHKDCDKTNNDISNLEWCTRAENEKHALENGLKLRGEMAGSSILSRNDVLQIRSLLEQNIATRRELSIAYNVTKSCIAKIALRKNWKHL